MERYCEYKDSGVKWLGRIPSHWESIRLENICSVIFMGQTPVYSLEDNGLYIIGQKNNQLFHIDLSGIKNANEKFYSSRRKYEFLKYGDVLLNTLGGGSVGRVGFFDLDREDILTDGHILIFRCKKSVYSKYIYYYLNTKRGYLENMASGSTNQMFLLQKDVKKLKVPIPPRQEQLAISDFLDAVTSKIDEAIAQQQKMIDLLNERKQIIINNAVSKGLNTKAPMKDSGVDWIGEIPEHWDIKRGKFLFDIINEYSSTGEEELLTVSDRTGITPRSMKNVTMFMAESLVGYKKCKIGDICSNIMWMWHGAVGVTKYDGVISPSYGVYRQRELYYNGDYLDMLLRLPQLVKFYASRSTGLTESRLRLYPDDFMNIYFFVPPMEEQEMIVNRLKSICEPIESAIDAATQQISLLQERKQIIINDVVTGKVKVS